MDLDAPLFPSGTPDLLVAQGDGAPAKASKAPPSDTNLNGNPQVQFLRTKRVNSVRAPVQKRRVRTPAAEQSAENSKNRKERKQQKKKQKMLKSIAPPMTERQQMAILRGMNPGSLDEISAAGGDVAEKVSAVGTCRLSKKYLAAGLQLDHSGLIVTGHRGYRSCKSNWGVASGSWYAEFVWIKDDSAKDTHVRVGVAVTATNLNGPIGFDALSYSYRDVDGAKVHKGARRSYGIPFGPGDTIGVCISFEEKWGK